MPKRRISRVPAIAAGLLTTLIAFSPSGVFGADCFAGPSRQTATSGHWYYHSDRLNNRKCWYLVQSGPTMRPAEAPDAQPSRDATSQPTLSSFFALLTASITGATPTGAQQASTNSDERTTQTARSDDPNNNDVPSSGRSRTTLHPNLGVALTLKHKRPSTTRSHLVQVDEAAVQAERDALFKEFLRWRIRQILD